MPSDPLERVSKSLSLVQDLLSNTTASDAELDDAAGVLAELAARLEPARAAITTTSDWSVDDPRRGVHTAVPQLSEAVRSSERVDGYVTFTPFHHGANGAVHGGVIPLYFDEILGAMASTYGTLRRTAYLTVHFRNVTPVNRKLRVEAVMDREEGRKAWFSGRLWDGDTITAEAEGMWVTLRPGAL